MERKHTDWRIACPNTVSYTHLVVGRAANIVLDFSVLKSCIDGQPVVGQIHSIGCDTDIDVIA